MESNRQVSVPIILKGLNYVLWSRMVKTALGGRGLGNHLILNEAPPKWIQDGEGNEVMVVEEEKWNQEDLYVLSVLQNSLDGPILEAYSHCETSMELWDILKKVYGNTSNLSRIFQVKQALANLGQEEAEFTDLFGKFSSLWAEHDMLRPMSFDPEVVRERREQDRVFSLLMVLSPAYSDLIKHILRSDKLPSLEDVCSQIQKERGSHGLFGGKGDMLTAHKGEMVHINQKGDLAAANKGLFKQEGDTITANKGFYKPEDKKTMVCDHCKKRGHVKDKCWILHPHLKPSKWKDPPRANYTQEAYNYYNRGGPTMHTPCQAKAAPSQACSSSGYGGNQTQPTQMVPYQPSQSEYVKKSDLDALIKALKESSGNVILGRSLHASFNALTMPKPLIVDSGASHHMISDLNLIKNIEPALGHVLIANGTNVPIEGIGDLRLFNKDSKAFYMPSFTSNLLSVKRATTDLNCHAIFGPNDFVFQDIETQQILGKGVTRNDLYVLEDLAPSSVVTCFSNLNNPEINGDLWHARLGHPHLRALEMMFPRMSFNTDSCEACILGKHCRSVFPHSQTVYENCFDLVHSDVWTAPCVSRENHKYFVSFIDEKSKYTWVTLIPSKGRVLEAFMNFRNYVTNQYDAKIKCLRSDNGGEYTSAAFKHYLTKYGIEHQTSCPYTPQQNGVAERKNRHLMEVTRAMMFHMKVPKRFWGDALVAACYLINRIPTKTLHDVSPFEVLTKTKPHLDHIRVFGCVCFVLVPGEQRNKLEAKSTKAMFIGYSSTQKGYKCFNLETHRVIISRDVKFLETKSYFEDGSWDSIKDIASHPSDRAENLRQILEGLGISSPSSEPSSSRAHPELVPSISRACPENVPSTSRARPEHVPSTSRARPEHVPSTSRAHPLDPAGDQGQDVHDQEDEVRVQTSTQRSDAVTSTQRGDQEEIPAPMELRRSTRQRFPSIWTNTRVYYNNQAVAHPSQNVCNLVHVPQEHQVFIGSLDQEDVPRTYEEAKQLKVWRDAVGDERSAMERNHTWDESDLPKGKKAVSSRWIFTIKYKSNGEIERYKARLVARGFTQTYGDDYRDTFAPVAKMHTIRVVLSLAANMEWDLWQMDVKNAFLQGELEEEVYMTPPPGLEDSVAPGKVLRLRKAIYGLKQSPRAWYHKLNVTLRDKGFRRSEADHTLFTLQSQAGIVVILIYVDDIIISGNDKVGIASTKEYLKSMFDIKDLGELKYFLGIEVCRFKDGLFISQRKYVLDLLTSAGMEEAKAAKTPLEDGYKVEPEGEQAEEVFEDPKLYRKLVGKLIYLTITRPDLCFAVNQVSQHMQAPTQKHWMIVHRILRYLKGTFTQGIWMGNNGNAEIVGYCDADWAGDRKDRKSTTGYCTFIGGNLVTWKTKKQKVVSCSSAEAEYRAMRKLTTECIWLKALLQDLGFETKTPITMHCDNQAAIHIASNSVFHERTKHIEVDCHKVREAVEKGIILPCFTRSADQLADIFTKAASTKVCEFIHAKLGLTPLPF